MSEAFTFDEGMRKRFLALATTNVSDALDSLRITGGLHGIVPIGRIHKFVGPAFTVKYIPVGSQPKIGAGDYIDDVKPGEVVVIDNAGRTYCTVWGDILTMVSATRGIAGTIIDGVCRDVDGILEYNYGLFARSHYMVTGKGRVQLEAVQVPVAISNVQVRPGDIMMADGSGAVVVPAERAEEVLRVAEEVAAAEKAIEAMVLKGSTLLEARRKYKYDTLQAPKDK